MLEVHHLQYTVQGNTILRDITAAFPSGKMIGIIGPNGCGKSTLLAHLSGLLPSRKSIRLDGQYIEEIPRQLYARRVAVFSQQQEGIAGDLLSKDIVLMGRYPYKERFRDYSGIDHDVADQIMARTGILPLANKPISRLSGGERQRVFIAKALAQEPDILLLDEPTNHLDVKYKIALMRELQHFPGTVIIVLHDLSLAARFCDEAIVMKDGAIQACGPTRQILTPDLLQKVFEIPFHLASDNGELFLYY